MLKIVVGQYINKLMQTNVRGRTSSKALKSSSVALERQGVVALPCGTDGWTSLGVQMTSAAKTTVLLSSGSQSTQLTVLVYRVHNPVDAGILADDGVLGIHQDNFEILVGRVLRMKLCS